MSKSALVNPHAIHLLIDKQGAGDQPYRGLAVALNGPPRLEIPDGFARLTSSPSDGPKLTATIDAEGVLLELVRYNQLTYLMALSQGPQRLRVNGHPAPAVVLLAERDHIQLDEETALHVAIYHQPEIGPPTPDLIGQICPVCLTPFTVEPPTVVYRCWSCQCVVHCEGDAKPEADRLECIRLSPSCPSCGVAVVMSEGYTWKPELNRE